MSLPDAHMAWSTAGGDPGFWACSFELERKSELGECWGRCVELSARNPPGNPEKGLDTSGESVVVKSRTPDRDLSIPAPDPRSEASGQTEGEGKSAGITREARDKVKYGFDLAALILRFPDTSPRGPCNIPGLKRPEG